MFKHGPPERRRNNDSEPVRYFREDMAGALGNLRGRLRAAHFALDPIAIVQSQGSLRGNLLRKETVRRRGRHAPGRSMRLIKKTAVLKIGHHIANRSGAQRLFEALGNRARGYRLARLDVGSYEIREDLSVAPFLKSRIPHSSTLR